MDKQSKNIDKLTHKLINEAGLENPSADFFSNVMEAIEVEKVRKPIAYKPLISNKVWVVLVALTVAVMLLLFLFPVFPESSLLNQLVIPEEYKFSFPEFHLSNTTIYGIGFLALFLIQIPFLKRQLEKSY